MPTDDQGHHPGGQQALLVGSDSGLAHPHLGQLFRAQAGGPSGHAGVDVAHHLGTAGDDAREQDDGDAVADAELGDLLTQPHQEGRTGGEGQDDDDARPDAVDAAAASTRP